MGSRRVLDYDRGDSDTFGHYEMAYSAVQKQQFLQKVLEKQVREKQWKKVQRTLLNGI